MFTLVAAAGLGAITCLSIYAHLRRASAGTGHRAKCPRCGSALDARADVCPACGVPQQVFDLVSARIAEPAIDDEYAPPRALIRSDLCVGCGACVAACPETGALSLRDKLAVVDPSYCKGHSECVTACPMGAISVGRGAATNRVVVPEVSANFETNVPGLYVVGELGGRGLIKNAVNEGRVAAEHVVRVAQRRRGRGGADPETAAGRVVDVAIVGSGPSGLSAGLEAHRAGLDYLVLEQGTLAETVRRYPRHKVLFAEPLTMPLYGDLWVSDASKENLLAVWEQVIARTGLRVRTQQRVQRIARDGPCFIISTTAETYRARAVILAVGRRGTPRRLGVPGEDLPTVFYDVAEMSDFAGRRVIVVGGGDSAVESALGLASQAGTKVTLSYRGDAFARIKDRNRQRIERAIGDGRVSVLFGSTVREIRPDVAVLDVDARALIVPCDDVIVRIGGEPGTTMLEQLGVRMVTKELSARPANDRFGSGDAA